MKPRSVTAYLLVATLLACPLPCLSHAAACAAGMCSGEASCGRQDTCCPGPESSSGKDRPGESDSRGDNGTCLCHGAVKERPTIPPAPDNWVVSLPPSERAQCVGELLSAQSCQPTERSACLFAFADSGRQLRALIESLLL